MSDRRWTFSTVLSVSRIILVVPLAYLLVTPFPGHRSWAAAVLLLGAATDWLDGYFARRWHQVTEWGKVVDPLADKLGTGATALVLVWLGDLEWWVLAAILIRDALILLGGISIHRKKGIVVQSNWPGKIAVSALAVLLFLSILRDPALEWYRTTALWFSMAMLVFSLGMYIQRLFIGRRPG